MRPVFENGLPALQVDLNEVQVELFATKKAAYDAALIFPVSQKRLSFLWEIDGVVLC